MFNSESSNSFGLNVNAANADTWFCFPYEESSLAKGSISVHSEEINEGRVEVRLGSSWETFFKADGVMK